MVIHRKLKSNRRGQFPYLKFIPHHACTGCAACVNACPRGCIDMAADAEHFMYPVVDPGACTGCGTCKSVCPVYQKTAMPPDGNNSGKGRRHKGPAAYAVMIKDEGIREKSSSGGVFTILADYVLDSGGSVFGAGFSGGCKHVKHMRITKREKLDLLRGSKYVQSSIGRCYQETGKCLEEGQLVLFTGTPCQIEGLLSYLGGRRRNLITADLICHGVPPEYIWSKYVDYREARAGARIVRTSFRRKSSGWRMYSLSLEFSNDSEYIERLDRDPYMVAFLNNADLRPSCYDCKFKHAARASDFTMADCWGIEHMAPQWDDDKGASLLLLHSEKAAEIFSNVKGRCRYQEVQMPDVVKYNAMLVQSMQAHPKRKAFFEHVDSLAFDELVRKYAGTPFSLRRCAGDALRKMGLRK